MVLTLDHVTRFYGCLVKAPAAACWFYWPDIIIVIITFTTTTTHLHAPLRYVHVDHLRPTSLMVCALGASSRNLLGDRYIGIVHENSSHFGEGSLVKGAHLKFGAI